MNPRTTGILFLVAAALGAFVYFYEIRGEESRQQAIEAEKRLFTGVDAEDVAWIELATSDGASARLERTGDGWVLREPVAFPADEFAANGVASALTTLASVQSIDSPQGDEVYGLAAATEIRFGIGEASHTLRLGDKTPVGGNTYARVGGAETVFAVPTYATSALTKRLDDLRERRILDFDRTAARRIELAWPDGGVVLERGDADVWRIVEPIDGPADDVTVDELLSTLSFLRADGFEDDPAPEEAAGLDDPELRAVVVTRSGDEGAEEERFTVEIAETRDGTTRLVRGGQPSFYLLNADRLDDVPRNLTAYRYKQLAEFVSTDADRVELTLRDAGGEPVRITASRGEHGWETSPEPMAAGRVGRMISELSRLRASGILADEMGPAELAGLGLSPPRARIEVFGPGDDGGDDAPPRKLAEVALGDTRASGVAAQTAGNPMVFALDYALAEHIPVSLEAFRNRFVSLEEPEEASAEDEAASFEPVLVPDASP